MTSVLLLAALPFGIKAITLFAGATGYGLQSLYKIAQLGVPLLWWRRSWQSPRSLLVVRPSVGLLAVAAAVSVLVTVLAIALILTLAPIFDLDPVELRKAYDDRFAVSGMGAVAVVVFLSFLNSALEELHFRAWLDRELSQRVGDVAGVAVSACAFGGMHGFILIGMPNVPTIGIVLMAIGLAFVGACWSMMMRRPGGIYAAWLSHGLTDALLLTWGLFWLGYL